MLLLFLVVAIVSIFPAALPHLYNKIFISCIQSLMSEHSDSTLIT